MADHALLSASGSHIWLNCTMAPVISQGLVRRPSKWADEGTRAHAVAEGILRGLGVNGHIDVTANLEADKDTLKAIKAFIDYVLPIARSTPIHQVEYRVSLDKLWTDDPPKFKLFGTADFVAVTPDRTLHVVDYKHGAGVPVDVTDNTQLLYYALGALLSMESAIEVERVRMVIVQPRAKHEDGPIREWEIPAVDVLEWGYSVLKPTADKIMHGLLYNPDTSLLVLQEGKHCRWCAANDGQSCPLKRKEKIARAQNEFEDIPDEL